MVRSRQKNEVETLHEEGTDLSPRSDVLGESDVARCESKGGAEARSGGEEESARGTQRKIEVELQMWGILLIAASLAGAMYIYSQKPTDKDKSDAWYEGYKAGILTPGPFTVLGILGFGYLIWR